MDYSDRDRSRDELRDRAPNWLERSSTARARGRSFLPSFTPIHGPAGWLLNLILLVGFCAIVTALGTLVFREWRPGIFMEGSPLSGLSPLPAVSPTPHDPQASASAAARTPVAAYMDLELQARMKLQEENDRRRAAAVKQSEVDEASARRRVDLEARREREWRAAYVKPPQCDELQPTVDSVGCANDYIRQRRKFDEQFLASARR